MVKPNNSFNFDSPPQEKNKEAGSMSLLDVLSASAVTLRTLRARRENLSHVSDLWNSGRIGNFKIDKKIS